MENLPFKLAKYHKTNTKNNWKSKGLDFTENDFNFVLYTRYIWNTKCDICNKTFEKSLDRQMEHSHTTNKFRNFVCQRCNTWKFDRKRPSDVSPYISKTNDKSCKQGFIYRFRVRRYGIHVVDKRYIELDDLIEYRDIWIDDNPQWFT